MMPPGTEAVAPHRAPSTASRAGSRQSNVRAVCTAPSQTSNTNQGPPKAGRLRRLGLGKYATASMYQAEIAMPAVCRAEPTSYSRQKCTRTLVSQHVAVLIPGRCFGRCSTGRVGRGARNHITACTSNFLNLVGTLGSKPRVSSSRIFGEQAGLACLGFRLGPSSDLARIGSSKAALPQPAFRHSHFSSYIFAGPVVRCGRWPVAS